MTTRKIVSFALRGLVMASFATALAANATQTVQPVKDTAGTVFSGSSALWTASVPVGTLVTVIGRYTTDNGNESGLGLKVKYDETKFTAGSVTVTALSTKCMIAPPQVQSAGAASQAVLGWIDTAIRTPAGTVGWPYLADPASPNACLNPNTPANDTAATAAGAVNLFRFQGTLAPAIAVGSTTDVTVTAEGNYSYAGPATPGMADQVVRITAAAAPSCNLDADGNGSLDGFADGILILRYLLGVGNATLENGVTANLPRNTAALVRAYLDTQNLAVVSPTTADGFVDGILILRLMLGVGNATLLNGVTLPAGAPTTAAAIRAQVNTRCGTSF